MVRSSRPDGSDRGELPGSRRRQPQGDDTRARLLDAARRVFVRIGYHSSRIDDIASEAGFTKGAFYWHFDSKQEVFLALIADAVAASAEKLRGLLEIGERDPEEMKRVFAAWLDRIDDSEDLPMLGVELEIESRGDAEFRKLHHALVLQHEAAIAAFLRRYYELAGGEPLLAPEVMAGTLVALFKACALARLNHPTTPVGSGPVARLLLGIDRAAA